MIPLYYNKEGPSLLGVLSDGYRKAGLDGAKLLCRVRAKRDQEVLKESGQNRKLETTLGKGSTER